jgi:phosphoribosyl 1,2-cyclic phosphodiesterase
MEHFSTAEGDRIRIECEPANERFAGGLALAVKARPSAPMIDGVLTSDAHADEIHSLFERGDAFRIVVRPAGDREPIVYEDCTLLSSSGKWTAERSDG